MGKIYLISKDECICDLLEFYENAAKVAGIKVNDKSKYDCRKICVTKRVQDTIAEYYRVVKGYHDHDIGVCFLKYGPKANLSDDLYAFEIDDGFVVENE